MTHIMLDLETWGKVPGSDIRSIGACVFDPVAGLVYSNESHQHGNTETFYVATDNPIIYETPWTPPQGGSEIKPWRYTYKLTRDPETVQWWNDQTPEAQAAFANPVDLRQALVKFGKWLISFDRETSDITDYPWFQTNHQMPKSPNVKIWANDPHFDVSILDAVFRAVQLPTPWHYRSPRSMRTIVEAAGMTSADYSNYGTAHNALDDAIAQAMTVCEAYKRLGLQR